MPLPVAILANLATELLAHSAEDYDDNECERRLRREQLYKIGLPGKLILGD